MWPIVAPAPERPGGQEAAATFSVVVPTYQMGATVVDAVESALTQTAPPTEVIVSDDGSTDGTEQMLAPYRDRIVYVRREHGGVGSAKNAAAGVASGDFIVVLDADNILLPGYLEALGRLASSRPDLDIITTDAYLELDGRVYGRYYRGKARFVVTDQRRGILHNHFIFGNAALRRERLLAIGGFDETLECGEDTDCFIRLILDGARAGLVDEPLAVYRLRDGSLSSNRPRSLGAVTAILERARLHPSLSGEERRAVDGDLAELRRLTALAQIEAGVRWREPGARARSLAVAFGPPGYGLATRLKAGGAALAPVAAGRFLALRERRTGASRLALRTRGR